MSSKYISLYPVLDNLKPDFTSNIKFFCVFGKDGNEVIIVTKDDKTYAFGSNYSGCLGLGHEKIVQEPTIVNELCGKQIVKIAYGYDHVIALTKCGRCFSWGDNSFGQLGQRDKKKRNRPSFINALLYETILDIQCGYSYSIVFGNSGKYFGFGFNTDGRLGCGDNNEHLLPIELVFLMKEKILSLSCGRCHSLALTENGQVLSWGNNNHGQLGFGDKMNRNTPLIIQFNDKISIKSIKACYWHSLKLSNEGIIYAFGYNSNGQLGIGNNSDQSIPLKVNTSVKYKEIASYLDNNFSLAMSENGFCYVWGRCEKASFIEPEQTSFKTIHEAFAKYASVKTTYKPIWLEEEINYSKNNQKLLLSECGQAIKIMKRISKLFNNEEFSDLKFKVEGKYIYVHKLILRTSCEYFRS
jgi:RCC1 and BTB domain-containing protein